MNRFGIIEDVSKILLDEYRNVFNEKYPINAFAKSCRVGSSDKTVIHVKDVDKFLEEHDINLEDDVERRLVAEKLDNFIKQCGVLPDYSKGIELVKYCLYFDYASKYPMQAFLMDKEIKLRHPDVEKFLEDKLYEWCSEETNGAALDGASIECLAVAYVFQSAEKVIPDERIRLIMNHWMEDLLSEKDRERLNRFFSNSWDDFTIYYSVMCELESVLTVYMTSNVVRSTPITVSSLYYCYISKYTFELRTMFTMSQGASAQSTVRSIRSKLCNQPKDPSIIDTFTIYKDMTDEELKDIRPDKAIADELYKIITSVVVKHDNDSAYRGIANRVSGKLAKFKEEDAGKEVFEVYNVRELLSAYMYYNYSDLVLESYTNLPQVSERVYEIKKTLPSTLQELSDAAVLILDVSRAYSNSYKNYYRHCNFERLLTVRDRELIGESYGNPDMLCYEVRRNLSWFADEYWLPQIKNAPEIQLLARCSLVTRNHRKRGLVPILSVAADRKELEVVVDDALTKAVAEDRTLCTLQLPALLAYLVIESKAVNANDSNGTGNFDDKIVFSDAEVQILSSKLNTVGVVDINEMVHKKLAQINPQDFGVSVPMEKLSVVDRMRLYIYATE